MLQIFWAQLTHDEDTSSKDQIILDTQWFNAVIIGRVFAGQEFKDIFPTLEQKSSYTFKDLSTFFAKEVVETDKIIELLDYMDLIHKKADETFLIPGKLSAENPALEWDKPHTQSEELKGLSIECKEKVDIFSPTVFPCVQKQLLDIHTHTAIVSRQSVKFHAEEIDVLVHLTKHKRAIHIAAKSPMNIRRDCYTVLKETARLVMSEVSKRSPGTDVAETHISQIALKESLTLEDVWTYTKKELKEAKLNSKGAIRPKGRMNGKIEYVSKILIQGML